MNKILTAMAVLAVLSGCSAQISDNTDPPGGSSGMGLYTDYMTGCQYLSRGSGSLTPRMDADGRQVCITVPVQQNGPN